MTTPPHRPGQNPVGAPAPGGPYGARPTPQGYPAQPAAPGHTPSPVPDTSGPRTSDSVPSEPAPKPGRVAAWRRKGQRLRLVVGSFFGAMITAIGLFIAFYQVEQADRDAFTERANSCAEALSQFAAHTLSAPLAIDKELAEYKSAGVDIPDVTNTPSYSELLQEGTLAQAVCEPGDGDYYNVGSVSEVIAENDLTAAAAPTDADVDAAIDGILNFLRGYKNPDTALPEWAAKVPLDEALNGYAVRWAIVADAADRAAKAYADRLR